MENTTLLKAENGFHLYKIEVEKGIIYRIYREICKNGLYFVSQRLNYKEVLEEFNNYITNKKEDVLNG